MVQVVHDFFDRSSQTSCAPAKSTVSPYKCIAFTLWDVNFHLMGSNFHFMRAPTIACGFTHKVKLDDAFFQ